MRNQLPNGLLCLFLVSLLLPILNCDNLDIEPTEEAEINSDALSFFEVSTTSANQKIFLNTVQIKGEINRGECANCLERVGFFYSNEKNDLFGENITFQTLTQESSKPSATRIVTRVEVALDSIRIINSSTLDYSHTLVLGAVDRTYYFRSFAVFSDDSDTKQLKRSHLSQESTPIEITLKDGWYREYHDGNLWAREDAFVVKDINNEILIGLGCAFPSFCDNVISPQPFLKFQVDNDEVLIKDQPVQCPQDPNNFIYNRSGSVAFGIAEQIYFGTGFINNATQKDIYTYNPNNCEAGVKILELPPSFNARKDAIGFSIDDYGYIGLGLEFDLVSTFVIESLSDFWRFDPSAPLEEQWCELVILDGIKYTSRSRAIMIETNDGSIIFGGGIDNSDKRLTDFWKLTPDPINCTATVVPLETVPIDLVGAFGDGISFTIGDISYAGLGAKNTNFYKFENEKWSPVASFPGSPILKGVGFSVGNRGYVFTGSFETSLPTDPPTELPPILSTDLWIYVPE